MTMPQLPIRTGEKIMLGGHEIALPAGVRVRRPTPKIAPAPRPLTTFEQAFKIVTKQNPKAPRKWRRKIARDMVNASQRPKHEGR